MYTVKTEKGKIQDFNDELDAFQFAVALAHLHTDLTFLIEKDGEVTHKFKALVTPENPVKYARDTINRFATERLKYNLAEALLLSLPDSPSPEEIH